MASVGPRSPSTAANDSSNGAGTAWTNPGNVVSSNDTRATISLVDQTSQYIKTTAYGFNLPPDSRIDGIILEIERSETGTGSAEDNTVSLVKSNVITGSNLANATTYPASDTYVTYGSSSNL